MLTKRLKNKQAKQNRRFVITEFVKTCDELFIGHKSGHGHHSHHRSGHGRSHHHRRRHHLKAPNEAHRPGRPTPLSLLRIQEAHQLKCFFSMASH